MLRHFVLFLSLTGLILSSHSVAGRAGGPDKRVVAQCGASNEIAQAVISLSRQYDEAQVAQRLLRQSAKRSSACRQQVVAAVMEAMDKPNLDISRDQASADLWREGAILLGDLKATQSLDLLLSHIKMTDGEFSMTMAHQPALEGIIRMGPVAIPKLKRLLQDQDWETRHYAVYCLAEIGGTAARRALQQAQAMESNPCVKKFMLVSIKMINGVKQEQGEWITAFLCTW
jgi:hypothetical protein